MRPPLPVDSLEPYDVPRSRPGRAGDVVWRARHGLRAGLGDNGWARGRPLDGRRGRLRVRIGGAGGDDMRAPAGRPDRPAGHRYQGGAEPEHARGGARRIDRRLPWRAVHDRGRAAVRALLSRPRGAAGSGGRRRALPARVGRERALALGIAVAIAGCGGSSEAKATGVRLQKVGAFDSPLYVTAPPGDQRRIFVVEQGGKIKVVRGGKVLSTPFLDITKLVTSGGEQGLLGLAFAPDYAHSGLFYVYYTGKDGNQRVVEYRRRGDDVADSGSARRLLLMPDHESNHNGGMLLFGADKLLYIGTGDGGGGGDQHGAHGNAQNLGVLLGKILRIDPRQSGTRPYGVPSSNPFAGRNDARGEIYAYGLRNPWRFSFDRKTGDLAIGDVGQGAVEEIDFRRRGRARGANFGWRVFEGDTRYTQGESAAGAVKPVISERHADGNCSITGGFVVRDPGLKAWAGRYVFGDYCRGVLESARLPNGKVSETSLHVDQLSSFGEDARGRVYAVSLSGPVYRLASR